MNMKKKIAALAVATGIVGASGVAYAYWTTTGSGTGSASVASANGTVTLHASVAPGIYPGGSSEVTFTADNAGDTDLRVRTIHLESVTADAVGCVVSDFTMADVASNTTVLHKTTGQAIAGTGTLVFANNPDASQDACKGATLTLNLTSN